MTREEVINLLETVIAAYPETFIKDAAAMVNIWYMEFSETKAEEVYLAVRLHISTKNKFPKISEIREAIPRALTIYKKDNVPMIEGKQEEVEPIDTGCDICPYEIACTKEECII